MTVETSVLLAGGVQVTNLSGSVAPDHEQRTRGSPKSRGWDVSDNHRVSQQVTTNKTGAMRERQQAVVADRRFWNCVRDGFPEFHRETGTEAVGHLLLRYELEGG
jgi:hypothetical protein